MMQRCPTSITGQLGYYAMAGETSIGPGTWEAAQAAADVALSAADHLQRGARSVFALCRPPGHHAEADRGRGFCLLGNIPIAVHQARATGHLGRVAILDWDAQIPKEAVQVTVEHGWVTLSGTVAWQYQRLLAAQAIAKPDNDAR